MPLRLLRYKILPSAKPGLFNIFVWLLVFTACSGERSISKLAPLSGLSLARAGGGVVNFKDFEGKVLMVDVFATWAQYSMIAVTGYSVLYSKYKEKGLEIVGIAIDELGDDVVTPYVRGMKITYPVGLADESIIKGQSLFGAISTIPILLVFDRQGILKKVFAGKIKMPELEKVVRDLLP